MSGLIDLSLLPCLKELEDEWETIREEVAVFEAQYDSLREQAQAFLYPNPKSKLPKTDSWLTMAFWVLGMSMTDLARHKRVTPSNENPTDEDIERFCAVVDYLHTEIFPKTARIFDAFMGRHRDDVMMISIFRLADQMFLPVHTNYDPFAYRCHMGILVPAGDIGMKVDGEDVMWEEGKFFAFDAMRPHTVWNFTGQSRYVVNVDCYRPEYARHDVLAVRDTLVDLRMSESKLTLGLSGGRSDLPLEFKRRYACHHEQLN
jgi:hypothetical protein